MSRKTESNLSKICKISPKLPQKEKGQILKTNVITVSSQLQSLLISLREEMYKIKTLLEQRKGHCLNQSEA